MREHMESENVHDFDTTIGTFDHPRYELVALHHADDAVIVELDLLGAPLGHPLTVGRAFARRAYPSRHG